MRLWIEEVDPSYTFYGVPAGPGKVALMSFKDDYVKMQAVFESLEMARRMFPGVFVIC